MAHDDSNEVQSDRSPPGLGPPQFGLGALLLLMAALGAMFALMNTLGGYGAFWLLVFVLAVLAHVAGNAIGTRLRESSAADRSHRRRGQFGSEAAVHAVEFAPATQLRERSSLGRPIWLITAAGVVLSGAAGGYFLASTNWERANPLNIAFGVFVCGILGGVWTYLGVGFIQVAFGALVQAMRDAKR